MVQKLTLIQQKRWLDAHDVLAEHLRKHLGATKLVAFACVQLPRQP